MSRRLTDLAGPNIDAEELLGAVLETAAQPLCVFDHDGVIRFVNPAAVAALGYDEADELLGRQSHEAIHERHSDGSPSGAGECPMLRPQTTGETVHCELDWFFRRSGSMLAVSYVSAPIAMPEGRGAVVAFTDIQDRLHAQQQASLRRVATLVADGTASAEVFTAIAGEVAQLLDMTIVNIWRFEGDGTATVMGTWSERSSPLQPGTNWSLEAPPIAAMARQIRAGRPARIDLPRVAGALADAARASGLRAGAGAPIIVGGEVWGMMGIGAADGEPVPDHIEDRLTEFTDLLATAIANTDARAEAARLAEEQAALRRVATLVAREASQAEVFTAIAEEIGRLLGADHVRMVRFEGEGAVVVGSSGAIDDPLRGEGPVPLEGDNAVSRVFRTRQPARIDDYDTASGAIAQSTSAMGIRGVVVIPILVEGRLWGAMGAGTAQEEPLPPETEFRLGQFTDLMATAIANTDSRATAERLAEEQAGLRRVATLVAKGAPPAELFAKVVEEVANVLDEAECMLVRDEGDGTACVAACRGAGFEAGFPVGMRLPVDGDGVTASVLRTGEPWRTKDYSAATGTMAERAHDYGIRSAVGCPIRVGGRIWGVIGVGRSDDAVLPPETETRLTQFSDLVATAIANAAARAEVERLAEEQAALRRVATLVAQGASPTTVFDAVAKEMEDLLDADQVGLLRYEPGEEVTVVAYRGPPTRVPPGSRLSHAGQSVAAMVRRTERPARIDDFEEAQGTMAELARTVGLRASVGVPVVVDGRLWGAITASRVGEESPPADTEERMVQFAQLLDTAIANSASRDEVTRLAEEQAALRRVATLVARGVTADAVFAAITQEAGRLLDVDAMHLGRYEPGDTVTGVATWWRAGNPLPLGTSAPVAGENVTALVLSTGRAARMDSYEGAGGAIAGLMRDSGIRSSVGAPILVDQRLWGVMIASSRATRPLPADTEVRIAAFTEVAATAIASTEARRELRVLADEQAALRRVATLVAQDVPPSELFDAVAREAGTLLGADFSGMLSYEDDANVAIAATWAAVGRHPPVPARFPTEPGDPMAIIAQTREPARVDDWAALPGPIAAFLHTELGVRCSVGSPVVVQGRLWGGLAVHSQQRASLPPDTEVRLAQFTDLVGTAIANGDARAEVTRLAQEQAALRRVATLVAEGASATAVFDAVAGEMEGLLEADEVWLNRYESGAEVTIVARRGPSAARVVPGTRFNHDQRRNVTAIVRRTERPARIEHSEEESAAIGGLAGARGLRSVVGAPVVVDGRLWGAIAAGWTGEEPPPADTEERMAQFAELLDTAIANADSRDQLTASRARLLTEADDARRRVVRDLHDGAQQRLVHTVITLKLAKRALGAKDAQAESLVLEALEQAERGNVELRELAHGILPAALTSGGLQAGVDAIVARLDLPIHVEVPATRFSPEIEASAYFIVAEALTNIIKHSHAGRAEVTASVADRMLHVEVRDDGIGGADPDGHGLVGIRDRATTLGGRLSIDNPAGGGTLVSAALPISAG